jgi:DNA-binding NarL/FixJ family response regulator
MNQRIALISCADALQQRLTAVLPGADPELDLTGAGAADGPCAVVAAVTGSPTATAAAVKKLRQRAQDLPLVVVISAARGEREARAAISAGADGAVLDADLDATAVATLEAVTGGQVAFPRTLLKTPKQPSFTRREKQAMGMMVLGFTNQEIGRRLGLAETTIKSHLSSAFAKLGVSSRSEATSLILDAANGVGLDVLAIDPD